MTHIQRLLFFPKMIFAIALIFLSQNLLAQACPPDDFSKGKILLKSGDRFLENNFKDFLQKKSFSKNEILLGKYYRIVQFLEIPNSVEKRKMENLGLEFLSYIPNKAFVVALPTDLEKNKLNGFGIHAVVPIPPAAKIDHSLIERPFGEWAVHGDRVDVVVKYFKNLSLNFVSQNIQNQGVTILESSEYMNLIYVRIPEPQIEEIAKLPFVEFLELVSTPGEPEDRRGRSLHRSTAINTLHPSGRHYDGSGVTMLCRDDGFVGPHIDLKGREFQHLVEDNAWGNHADGVSGIMAGAGNVNPIMQGMAPGADLYVTDYAANFLDETYGLHLNENVVITNSSYSNGCNAGYTTITQTVDRQIFDSPTLIHVFSAGNSNNNECGYGAGDQWGNVTGGHKQGKNVIATANLLEDASLVGSSSRGPAHDGRIKPDIAANGNDQFSFDENHTYSVFGGTSAASPGVAGVTAQLYQAYKELNGGEVPNSGLIKAILMNTANDLGNVGPDFKFGWGHLNAYRAVRTLEDERYESASVGQGDNNAHTLSLPDDVQQVRVMLYWMDPEAGVSVSKALVNDLDMEVTTPSGDTELPWILDATPNPDLLDMPATKGEDHLNNVEQVLLNNPSPGNYTISVSGFEVPFGPQEYFLVYEIITDQINITYPNGGEGFAPGTGELIHWDAYGTDGIFMLEYSLDNGDTWNFMKNVSEDFRMTTWNVPNEISGEVKIRISNNVASDETDVALSICPIPQDVHPIELCEDYLTVAWSPVDSATGYDVFYLGEKYMDSIGTAQDTFFQIPINDSQADHWFAVRAVGADGLRGRRSIAERFSSDLMNCPIAVDLSNNFYSTPDEYELVTCGAVDQPVTFSIRNNGTTPQYDFELGYQVQNQIPVTEIYTDTLHPDEIIEFTFTEPVDINFAGNTLLKMWVSATDDMINFNDTITQVWDVDFENPIVPLPELFENFGGNFFPPADWYVINDDDNDTWGRTTVTNLDDNFSSVAYVRNYFYDAPGERDELFSSPIDLTAAGIENPYLSFDVAYSRTTTDCSDTLRIEIYTECGAVFQENIYEKFDNALVTNNNQGADWRPNNVNDWRRESISLADYVGEIVMIKFVNINGACNNLFLDNINIANFVAPQASFTPMALEVCKGDEIIFESTSIGSLATYSWKFGSGAFPYGISTDEGPHLIQYLNIGTKEVSLIVSNALGSDTMMTTITVYNPPVADFSADVEGVGYRFTNQSVFETEYLWNFGDGQTSTEESPLHFYAQQGTYNVSLTALNGCDDDVASQSLNVTVTSVQNLGDEVAVQVSPNPNDGNFVIELKDVISQKYQLEILDLNGKIVHFREVNSIAGKSTQIIENQSLAQGIYFLKIKNETGVQTLKIVVQK